MDLIHLDCSVDAINPEKTYNPYTIDTLPQLNDAIDWLTLFRSLSANPAYQQVINGSTKVIVEQPDYMQSLARLWTSTDPLVLEAYILW